MAAWRYEISLRVLKNVKYFSTREEKFLISKRPCDILLIFYYIKTNEIPNHFIFAIYYVTIVTVLSSRVKISRFPAKAHLVFHCCLYNKHYYLCGQSKEYRLLQH